MEVEVVRGELKFSQIKVMMMIDRARQVNLTIKRIKVDNNFFSDMNSNY